MYVSLTKMKPFSKKEVISLAVIFFILVAVSVPNYIVSLRRARDQVRRDDMGALQKVLANYFEDFREFPMSSDDGRMIACNGACEWGKDAIVGQTKDGSKVYMNLLPREPKYQEGRSYRYISDGQHYQILVALEGTDEDEYDQKIIARGLKCGNVICNAGRGYGCETDKSLEQCNIDRMKGITQ